MGHIGNTVQTAFTSFGKQTITGTGTAVYTLSHSVANEQEIEVFVNNVRQEGGSGKAFTVSGNQITFSENIASTDTVYVNFAGKALQTVAPPDGSVTTARIADGAVTSNKLDTNINIAGTLDVTGTLTADYVKPTLIAFQARLSADITGFDTTDYTTSVSYDVTDYNNGSAFNTSGSNIGLFIAPVAGLYTFDYWVYSSADAFSQVWLTENGVRMPATDLVPASSHAFVGGSATVKLASGDKIGVHPYNGGTSERVSAHTSHTYFRGHLVTAI